MTKRFEELDALRGIAAVLVVVFHFTMGRPEAQLGFKFGVTGVDLFFIISGFVIFMSLNKVTKPIEFVINRISRLYPTYWTCVTFTFILQIVSLVFFNQKMGHSFLDYLANMTMFQYYFMVHNLDGSYWSMPVEMLFYISILFIFVFKKLKNIIEIGLIILTVTIFNDLFLEVKFPALKFVHQAFTLLNHFPLFLAGIIFYKLMNDENINRNKKIFYYAVLMLSFVSQLLLFDNGGRSYLFISFGSYAILLLIYFVLFLLFINQKIKFIVNKYSLYVGKISFALYLVHQYFGTVFVIPNLMKYCNFSFWFASIIAFILAVLLATFITQKIEIPFSKRMNQKLKEKFLTN